MKRAGMVMMILMLLVALATPSDAAPQLTLGTVSIEVGETGSLSLVLAGGEEPYAGVNAKILLPDGISAVGVSPGVLLSTGNFTVEYEPFSSGGSNGVTVIAYSGTDVFNANSSVILSVAVRADWSATPGSYSSGFAAINDNPLVNARYALSSIDGSTSIEPTVSSGTFTITPMTDTDGDGLSDLWEQQIVDADPDDGIDDITDVHPGDDFDGDGFSNLSEYLNLTDPTDDSDYPVITACPEDFETGDLENLPWTTGGSGMWTVNTGLAHGGLYAAESPAIGDDESASIQTKIYCGQGNVSFWYSVSSESDYDYLRFYIYDIEVDAWSGEVDYTEATYPVNYGWHTFKWVYEKDKSDSSGSDAAWIDDVSIPCAQDSDNDGMPNEWEFDNGLDPQINDAYEDSDGDGFDNIREFVADTDPQDEYDFPAVAPLIEDFETGDFSLFPWFKSGNGGWSITETSTHGGSYAAQSPALEDYELAVIQTIVFSEQGDISFWYSVDSESGYDYLRFYVDDVQQGEWSGNVPYTQTAFAISAGMHTFKWVYEKDKSASSGLDTSWVDDITFPGFVDTDSDGMPDGWELDNGLDPLFDDSLKDYDDDGASNLAEFWANTDPWDDMDFPSIPYDEDGDNDIDGSDLGAFIEDLANGLVDETDLAEFANHFGR